MRKQRKRARTEQEGRLWSRCAPADDGAAATAAATAATTAYVLLTSPFARSAGREQGPVQAEDVLRMHLLALGRTAGAAVAKLMVAVPSERQRGDAWEARVAGDYLDVQPEAAELPFASSPNSAARTPH